jgi:putative addiction module component (TIGR02574 family)
METAFLSDILKLSVPQRLQLLEAIGESITPFPEAVDLTESQRNELESRLQAYYFDRAAGIPWKQLRAKLNAL